MPSAGNTVASMACSSIAKSTAGYASTRSPPIFTRRAVTSCGIDWSMSLMSTASALSAKRCSCTSQCAVAVPLRTEPTRRGAYSARQRMACSATWRWVRSDSAWDSAANRRWYWASAASISIFFGSTAPSTTPKRSAALRFAARKSRMPCSAITRAASCASASRRFSARTGRRLFIVCDSLVLKNRLARCRAFRTCGGRAFIPGCAAGGQVIHQKSFGYRFRILAACEHACLGRDLELNQPIGHRSAPLRHAAQRLAHEVHPDRQRGLCPLFALAERSFLIKTDPHRAHKAAREAIEPRVLRLIGRAGLAGKIRAPERHRAAPGAALDHIHHHVRHEIVVLRTDDAFGKARRRQIAGSAAQSVCIAQRGGRIGTRWQIGEAHCFFAVLAGDTRSGAPHDLVCRVLDAVDEVRLNAKAAVGEHGVAGCNLEGCRLHRAEREREICRQTCAVKAEFRNVVDRVRRPQGAQQAN